MLASAIRQLSSLPTALKLSNLLDFAERVTFSHESFVRERYREFKVFVFDMEPRPRQNSKLKGCLSYTQGSQKRAFLPAFIPPKIREKVGFLAGKILLFFGFFGYFYMTDSLWIMFLFF